jgi:nucleoside-diphosphate-sugar epimerase
MKNVLITGNMGYVGPVVAQHLRQLYPSIRLIGLDTGLFADCLTNTFLPEVVFNEQRFGDVRDIESDSLVGIDAIVHLAAISNDPIGNRFEEVTNHINHQASVALANAARDARVKSFVFASSCSVYGAAGGNSPRSETDEVNPLTAYARSKIATEDALSKMDHGPMKVTILRFATACGMSDRLRLDLVLNDFVAGAVASKKITLLSDGTAWRPLIDVHDMARAIEWAIFRGEEIGGSYLIVNVGSSEWNYQVRDLAQAVAAEIPETRVVINNDAQSDIRSYRVDFSQFLRLAPNHQPRLTLKDSICALSAGLKKIGFADPDFRESRLIRLRALQAHLDELRLTPELRWMNS